MFQPEQCNGPVIIITVIELTRMIYVYVSTELEAAE